MTKQTEAMKLALEALDETLRTLDDENAKPGGAIADTIWYSPHETLFDYLAAQITALREALAEQPAQQPLFKQLIDLHPGLAEELKAMDTAQPPQEPDEEPQPDGVVMGFTDDGKAIVDHDGLEEGCVLYTSPPAQRKPLTDEQAHQTLLDMATHIEEFGHENTTEEQLSGECIRFILGRIVAHDIKGKT